MKYDFKVCDKKWQDRWEKAHAFEAKDDFSLPKFYALIEFPYPSGAGLHVGHIKAFQSLEVISRYKRMRGYNVLFPIGFDAFGLNTANYAIKTRRHPRDVTDENIAHFTQQLKRAGFSFDWSRVIDTTDEDYYKWTQWIFLKMFEHGLVYRDKAMVNFCPHCNVVLSNEDSQGGKCDVCHSDVIQKAKDVWYLRITKYADRMLEGLEHVDYPQNIKQQQINWIGKSTGAYVNFPIKDTDDKLRVYTTRPDTLFGATFMVIAPEHPIIDKYSARIANIEELNAYKAECAKKNEFERTQLVKEKTGVKIEGLTAINPINGAEIPIYIADYVMMSYGTGAIMAVPAHDSRDYEFAKKFGLPIIEVIKGGNIDEAAYEGDGEMINSGFLNGITTKKEAIERAIEYLTEHGIGEAGVQYKMKDWAFNRQIYWGEPIPIIYCPKCGMVPVPYEELPLRLPDVKNIEQGVGGESPLAKIESFVNCKCPQCGGDAKRETDTMPQWAGSSWYFLRYCDPHNDKCLADPEKLRYWMPVDWYNGGMEHVTRHMIYSRFWHMFLYDIGVVPTPEPYKKRSAVGLVLGADGEKMSKSKGNVVDPNDVIEIYGADTLRTYILFMGDYGMAAPWNDSGVKGCRRFLDRVAGLTDIVKGHGVTPSLERSFHKTIKKVSSDIEEMKFNTAIAALMTLINEIYDAGTLTHEELVTFIRLLYPFAPHICEEINEYIGETKMLAFCTWPEYDEAKTIDDTIEVAIQINGKLRGTIMLPRGASKDDAIATVKVDGRIAPLLEGKTIVKEIYVPDRIVNIVVR